jgi:hypothetical protein
MKGNSRSRSFEICKVAGQAALVLACLAAFSRGQQTASQNAPAPATAPSTQAATAYGTGFDTPQLAAAKLVQAAGDFDETGLVEMFGPGGDAVVFTGELPQDKERAADFAAMAHEKMSVSVEPKNGNRAFVLVGNEDWPFPVPLVKAGSKWYFDSKAGEQELLYRRIGANENDAIDLCEGYVEAQYDFAYQKRSGYEVNQYAQHIIAPAGTQDGLAWQDSDGTWKGPIGEKVARAIVDGYQSGQPYHGYFFKVLKGQGKDAPLGEMNYVVKGVMIGGFALVASPAEYRVTGVKTFIVSNDGVVYEKDFGAATADEFKKMEVFNPDKSWMPVTNQ